MQQGQGLGTPARPGVLTAGGEPRAAGRPSGAGTAVLTADVWDRMAVSAPPVPKAAGALPDALSDALAVIDAGFAVVDPARAGGARAVPSAGALHPYECHVITEDTVWAADAVRRRVHRTGAADPVRLAAAGVRLPAPGGSLIVVVARPWLSMRKYGDRGYLYTHLDTAHLAVNMLGVAGPRAELRLRVRREPLAALLGIDGRCREVHSVLRTGPGGRSATGWTAYEAVADDPAAPGTEEPSWLERLCWQALGPVVAPEDVPPGGDAAADGTGAAGGGPTTGNGPDGADGAGAVRTVALTALLPAGTRLPVGAATGTRGLGGRWGELSAGRRSSKAFGAGGVTAPVLGRALDAARTALAHDLPRGTDLRVTLAVRSVGGLAPGAYRLAESEDRAELPLTDDDLVRACMNQDHLGAAAAAVLFHLPRRVLVDRPPAVLREALFRAGGLGQLLYLGATDAGLGVTGVGGFDTRRWRRLGCLPEDDELLYLVLLGADAGSAGPKWDRLQAAYAQGGR